MGVPSICHRLGLREARDTWSLGGGAASKAYLALELPSCFQGRHSGVPLRCSDPSHPDWGGGSPSPSGPGS